MLARARRSVVVIDAGSPRNAPADGRARAAGPRRDPAGRAAGARPGGGARLRRPGGLGRGQRGARRRRRVRGDAGRRLGRSAPAGCWWRPGWSTSCRTCRGCASAGAGTCCTARTATAGRSATSPSACWPAGRCRCTRRCCSGSGATTSRSSPTPCRRRPARQAEQLAARGIRVVGRRGRGAGDRRRPAHRGAAGRRHRGRPRGAGGLAADGRARRTSSPRSACGRSEHPSGIGEHVPADPTGRTEVPGVWVAGNVTDPVAQVGAAAAAGAVAGGPDQRRPGRRGDPPGRRRARPLFGVVRSAPL